ncbi:hypothetical protein [Actinokineospora diospyrosa]|uniref:HK97 family phage major capsid protein n=1 Tax=Actinokineospora diospyrosa TaxID=103728 RepID=A0ABT1IFU7_9PSEU|nr:hypothetical protein [Actinokineospora diospyrosa]MCP2271502.1 hypothetical protein [Actinokineospora diospyrosa]
MKAVDWVVDKIAGVAKKLWAKLKGAGKKVKDRFSGKPGSATDRPPQVRLRAAVREATALMGRPDATTESVTAGLGPIRERHALAALELDSGSGHDRKVTAKINPQLSSDSRKIPSPDELRAIREHAQRVIQLWRINGVGEVFKGAGRAKRRDILLDAGGRYNSYSRPGGDENAPKINTGDLVEVAAEPGLRRVAAATGSTLLVNPALYLVDAEGAKLGGDLGELDFLLLGKEHVRVLSAKTNSQQFTPSKDTRSLDLFRTIPDNPAAFDFASNYRGWGPTGNISNKSRTVGAAVFSKGMSPVRIDRFRAYYLNREQTKTVSVEPLHPKGQGEGDRGYTLRMDLADLVELYIREIAKGL